MLLYEGLLFEAPSIEIFLNKKISIKNINKKYTTSSIKMLLYEIFLFEGSTEARQRLHSSDLSIVFEFGWIIYRFFKYENWQ